MARSVVAACEQGQRIIDELDELVETGFGDAEVRRVDEMILELGLFHLSLLRPFARVEQYEVVARPHHIIWRERMNVKQHARLLNVVVKAILPLRICRSHTVVVDLGSLLVGQVENCLVVL